MGFPVYKYCLVLVLSFGFGFWVLGFPFRLVLLFLCFQEMRWKKQNKKQTTAAEFLLLDFFFTRQTELMVAAEGVETW